MQSNRKEAVPGSSGRDAFHALLCTRVRDQRRGVCTAWSNENQSYPSTHPPRPHFRTPCGCLHGSSDSCPSPIIVQTLQPCSLGAWALVVLVCWPYRSVPCAGCAGAGGRPAMRRHARLHPPADRKATLPCNTLTVSIIIPKKYLSTFREVSFSSRKSRSLPQQNCSLFA